MAEQEPSAIGGPVEAPAEPAFASAELSTEAIAEPTPAPELPDISKIPLDVLRKHPAWEEDVKTRVNARYQREEARRKQQEEADRAEYANAYQLYEAYKNAPLPELQQAMLNPQFVERWQKALGVLQRQQANQVGMAAGQVASQAFRAIAEQGILDEDAIDEAHDRVRKGEDFGTVWNELWTKQRQKERAAVDKELEAKIVALRAEFRGQLSQQSEEPPVPAGAVNRSDGGYPTRQQWEAMTREQRATVNEAAMLQSWARTL